MRLTIARFPKLNILKVGGASNQSTISGWGEHDVRIPVPFTRCVPCAHAHHMFGTLIG